MFKRFVTVMILSTGLWSCSLPRSDAQAPYGSSPGTTRTQSAADPAVAAGSRRQTGAPTVGNTQAFIPIAPLIVEYEYSPHYFMQWLDDHPRYARIEVSVSDAEPPVFNLVLTEKGSGRRVNYSNSEERVKALTRSGVEARLAKIGYRASNKFGQLPAHEFDFTDERGQAAHWRFTLAAPVSERGAGLTPQESGEGWIIIYRDLGTAAGEGSAVQIGNQVSEAEPWPEISAPPYFVAFRGTYAEGLGVGVVLLGQESWRVTAAPQQLNVGAEWTLTDQRGRARRWRVAARRGDELTINEIGSSSQTGRRSLQARQTATGLALRAVTLTSGSKTMRIGFSPELDLTAPASSSSDFQIDQNGRDKLIHGRVSVERQGGAAQLRWQPKSPDWAKSRVLNSTLTMYDNGYKVEVR